MMLGTSHRVSGGPPSEETFLSAPPEKNPIRHPSGEKNGAEPPAVAARGLALIGRVSSRSAQMFVLERSPSPRFFLCRSPVQQRRPLAFRPCEMANALAGSASACRAFAARVTCITGPFGGRVREGMRIKVAARATARIAAIAHGT
jgi:hypothetical protein